MKLRNKIGAFLGTLALAVALTPVSALGAAENSISVTGLSAGDSATYYQIIKRNATTGEWELAGTFGDLTIDDLLDGIDAAEAGIIVAAAQNGTSMGTVAAGESGLSASDVDLGTYLIIATPADNNTVYGPMFVSADYEEGGNSIDPATADPLAAVAPSQEAVAKKSEVTLDKKAEPKGADNDNSAQNVGVGDTVAFTVETTMPTFTSAQKDLYYHISDEVSTGLAIDTGTISVSVEGYEVTAGTDYVIESSSESGWEISFTESFLRSVKGNPKVTVTYDAEVTEDAEVNVNELTNEAKVEFTHSPDGSHGSKTDETYHYSYGFDVPVSGVTGENSEEFIKVGVDAEGNPISDTIVTIGGEEYSPLADAVFTLQEVNGGGSWTSTSLASGLFSFTGLDAGRYTLKETTPPAGFAVDPDTYYVEILPVFNNDGTLASYTVTCGKDSGYDNPPVSSFTIDHTTDPITSVIANPEPLPQIFENTKVPSLPTTGGAGTLALTVGGVALIAVGILVIMRVFRESEQA